MTSHYRIIPLFMSILTCVCAHADDVCSMSICDGWRFRQARSDNWHNATVPGTVHTDLMDCGLINDPFFCLNELGVQWIDKEDWIYETCFTISEQQASSSNKRLVFEGLDTYADVYLNDSLILEANNMFRTWRVNVNSLLNNGKNTLRIYFHSPIKVDLPKWNSLPYQYEAINDQSANGGILDRKLSPFSRKAGYHYGWDWGPRLVTSGIWRPIRLETWTGVRIEDTYIRQKTTQAHSELSEKVEILSDDDCLATLTVTNSQNGKILARKKCHIKKGMNDIELNYVIKNPHLWWTNGLGKPNLYTFVTSIETIHGKSQTTRRVGLRSLRLLTEPDSIGREFCFELNGKRVFMKGADYIPCDNFLPRVSYQTYKQTIDDAVAVNMNMLRVWGGGVYENDLFYDLCDENGLLVWQDFMFACSLYPASGDLLDNIKEEAIDNVRRLRNHPCIALWCGNNECQDAYYGWGWKENYYAKGHEIGLRVQKEFEELYYKVLPEIVKDNDIDTQYWPSSPFSDYYSVSKTTSGDYHYWGVWHAKEPIRQYNTHRARFYSEYGMQSFPEFESVICFNPDSSQWDIHSDVMMSHQRGGSFANSLIETYLQSEYTKPNDFASLLYVGQLMQGDAMKTAVEAHRRDKGYCWGTLIWQINDCWPVASWSTRDWYGRWKAAHYMIRHAMDDILVSPIEKDDSLFVYIVNDRLQPISGQLDVRLMTLNGQTLYHSSIEVLSRENSSDVYFSIPTEKILVGVDRKNVIVIADLITDKTYTSEYCLQLPKNMEWPTANVTYTINKLNDGSLELTLHSDTFARGVFLSLPDAINPFTDNYFNILPNKTKTVRTTFNITEQQLRDQLKITHLDMLYQ